MESGTTPDERDSRPPMSTTSLPETPSDAPRPPVRPPVLASDILLEDVAPRQPAANVLRLALATVALVFLGLGVLDLAGAVLAFGAWGEFAVGVVAIVLVLFPLPYRGRASLAALTALVPLVLGTLLIKDDVLHRIAGLVTLGVLPGVLFFRARYRALDAARMVLAIAFVLAAPGLWFAVTRVLNADVPLVVRVLDGALVAGALAGAFGFMGAETTGMCGVWATTTLVLASAHVAAVTWNAGWRVAGVAALVCVTSTTLLALALFQLLASAFAATARRVDIHRPVMESESQEAD
jgi:hypothetical protein